MSKKTNKNLSISVPTCTELLGPLLELEQQVLGEGVAVLALLRLVVPDQLLQGPRLHHAPLLQQPHPPHQQRPLHLRHVQAVARQARALQDLVV